MSIYSLKGVVVSLLQAVYPQCLGEMLFKLIE